MTFSILKGAVWLNLLCYVIAYKPHQPAVEDKKDKQAHQVISEHFWELQQERENLQMCLDKWRHSNSSLQEALHLFHSTHLQKGVGERAAQLP